MKFHLLTTILVAATTTSGTAFVVVNVPRLSSPSFNRCRSQQQQQELQQQQQRHVRALYSSAAHEGEADDSDIQWELFQKYHASPAAVKERDESKTSWKGVWTTYDYMGDILDETVASVEYDTDSNAEVIQQTHNIVIGATRSDCATCFDSMDIKTIPVATYDTQSLRTKKVRFAANGMVIGPTVLRSGTMATEVVLSDGFDARVRVIFQHAPVWQRDIEPGSCPPQGLKLFRVMVSKEAAREAPPTAETEAANAATATEGQATFFRSVPPFDWHKHWAGTSWTWGPQSGDRGWSIDEVQNDDAWHGSAPVEVWNLRLPGGVFLQGPRVMEPTSTGLFRLAWLPTSEKLLRVEAGVLALQPILDETEELLIGLEPPSLVSLRCDVLQKVGDLQGEPSFVQQEMNKRKAEEEEAAAAAGDVSPASSTKVETDKKNDGPSDNSGLQAIRDALQL